MYCPKMEHGMIFNVSLRAYAGVFKSKTYIEFKISKRLKLQRDVYAISLFKFLVTSDMNYQNKF